MHKFEARFYLPKDSFSQRKIAQNKILTSDPASLEEYELLETILFYVLPKRDAKYLAKKLLETLGDIRSIVYTDVYTLLQIKGMTQNVYLMFSLTKEIVRRVVLNDQLQKIHNGDLLENFDSIVEYLKLHMGNNPIEQFRVLFLNKKNILIADEIQTTGTIDQTAIYPREVIRKSMLYNATSLILVHNHPTGNPQPSKADLHVTKLVKDAAALFDIKIYDHIIVGKNKFFSFKSNALL